LRFEGYAVTTKTEEQKEQEKAQARNRQGRKAKRDKAKIESFEEIRASATPIVDTFNEYGPVLRDVVSLLKQALLEGEAGTPESGSPEVFVLTSQAVDQLALLKRLNDPSQNNALGSDEPQIRFLGLTALQWQEMPDELLGIFGLRGTVAKWKARTGASVGEVGKLSAPVGQALPIDPAPQEGPNADRPTGGALKDTSELSEHASLTTSIAERFSNPEPIDFSHMSEAFIAWRTNECPSELSREERPQWLRRNKFPYAGLLWVKESKVIEERPADGMRRYLVTFRSADGHEVTGETQFSSPPKGQAA
jgi:hypothetical protein